MHEGCSWYSVLFTLSTALELAVSFTDSVLAVGCVVLQPERPSECYSRCLNFLDWYSWPWGASKAVQETFKWWSWSLASLPAAGSKCLWELKSRTFLQTLVTGQMSLCAWRGTCFLDVKSGWGLCGVRVLYLETFNCIGSIRNCSVCVVAVSGPAALS